MNPPDREGRVGHPFEWGGWAPNYVGTTEKVCRHCGLSRSAHTGGEAAIERCAEDLAKIITDEHDRLDLTPGQRDARFSLAQQMLPQPAPQGGGGEQRDNLDDMIVAFDNARTPKEATERKQAIIDLFASDRAAHVESLQRLLHRASQGDISAADVQAELAALQP